MGMINKFANILKLKKEKMTILVIGLNNSGKSTIINHFKQSHKQTVLTVPTVGFTVEQFQNFGVFFTAIDMAGSRKYRTLWQHHLRNCQGIIFVIDSSDKMRLVVVKEELNLLLNYNDLKDRFIPILFYSNKSDNEDALTSAKISSALNIDTIVDKPWHISSSNAISGEGLEEGMQWLVHQIRNSALHIKASAKLMKGR